MIVHQAARYPGAHRRHRAFEVAKCLSRREANLPATAAYQTVDDLKHRPSGQPCASAFLQGLQRGDQSLIGGPTGHHDPLDGTNEPVVVSHGSPHRSPNR